MRTRSSRLVFVVVWSLCSASASAQGLTRADRPEFKLGDTWQYYVTPRTGEKYLGARHIVRAIAPDEVTIGIGKTVRRVTPELNVIDNRSGDTVTSSHAPYWRLYSFPLEIGKEWSGRWQSRSSARPQVTYWSATVKVVGTESATVAAGTFETLKLEFRGDYYVSLPDYQFSGSWREFAWYAPAVKQSVKGEWLHWSPYHSDSQSYELASYKVAQ